jgi:hypothetical protein
MGLIPLGILSSAGSQLSGTFELIETKILASAASSVTFESLSTYSSTYKHLQIRLALSPRGDEWLGMRINGDTTHANYESNTLRGTGSVVNAFSSGGEGGSLYYVMQYGSSIASSVVIDIVDAYAAKNKVIRALGGSTTTLTLSSGAWFSTATLSSLRFGSSSGDFTTGSRFSIYGIRG